MSLVCSKHNFDVSVNATMVACPDCVREGSTSWQARECTELAALRRFFVAYQHCDQNRGVFSCVERHDGRCPKSRDPDGTRWRGGEKRPWRCECGREELDAAEIEVEQSTRIRLLMEDSR